MTEKNYIQIHYKLELLFIRTGQYRVTVPSKLKLRMVPAASLEYDETILIDKMTIIEIHCNLQEIKIICNQFWAVKFFHPHMSLCQEGK